MIYLVHHADAVAPDVDAQRPLSAAGRAHVERLSREVAARGVKPDIIWHSGKLRARQTAEAFWRACNPLAVFSAMRGLQPSDPPEWVRDMLAGESREVMLVGHLPHLPRLLDLLVGDTPRAVPAEFPLHGIVALANADGSWTEVWRISLP